MAKSVTEYPLQCDLVAGEIVDSIPWLHAQVRTIDYSDFHGVPLSLL